IMDSRDFDRRQALLEHKQMLRQRQVRLTRLMESVDRTLAAMERGITMDEKELFDGFEPSQYEAEVKQRWGGTREYADSARRTAQYTKADWTAIQQEMQAIWQGVAALMDRSPADPAVQEWVRRWHQTINDRFYTCSLEVLRGLADMYVQDERFTANYDKVKPGLAQFWSDAMKHYCDANA
ncbi:MAG: TipAS antibiotic-recognition domain-containing protein, partial [Mycobacterium leprae]